MPADLPADLPGLLALWAERHPNEVTPHEYNYRWLGQAGTMYHLDGECDGPHSVEAVDEPYNHHLVAGHAAGCIARAGFRVFTAQASPGPGSAFTASAEGPHLAWAEASGDSLAVALVRLRLSLPVGGGDDDAK